ncbi:MAG TPA: FAD-dependent oxidoreductase, partial [Ilumatobacteraceae bacterium]|nr:FAD-dependent oxidoreductase [Ilumatobacteraceae bacterium]
VEQADSILPLYDAALVRPVAARLDALGVTTMVSARAVGYDAERQRLSVRLPASSGGDTGGAEAVVEVGAERVLVCVGRRPATEGWGLERLGLTRRGAAVVIDDRCRTSMAGVYAIGDLTGEPMLAHRA